MAATRSSTALVLHRCLSMLRRLERGPATRQELIETVLQEVGDDAYGGATGRDLDRWFEEDKKRLQAWLGARWQYRRAGGTYELLDVWEPLLDLPDTALNAVVFLQETFDPGAPMSEAVQRLLGIVSSYLSPDRRAVLEQQRTALQLEWGRRDEDVINPEVEQRLRTAIVERRRVAFDYYSPAQVDEQPRRHVVELYQPPFFDAVRGHYYLRGYCRYTVSDAYGEVPQNCYFRYRLGRIRAVHLLPNKLPPHPPRARREPLVYRLAAEIARRGEITRHPDITILEIEPQPDESVIVHAETEDVWWAVRALLHYGPSCQVLGGDEALYEMRRLVREMARVYGMSERA